MVWALCVWQSGERETIILTPVCYYAILKKGGTDENLLVRKPLLIAMLVQTLYPKPLKMAGLSGRGGALYTVVLILIRSSRLKPRWAGLMRGFSHTMVAKASRRAYGEKRKIEVPQNLGYPI